MRPGCGGARDFVCFVCAVQRISGLCVQLIRV